VLKLGKFTKLMSNNKLVIDQGDSMRAVIELYKKDVDRTLIRHNLNLTVEERLLNLQNFNQFAEEFRNAGKNLRTALQAEINDE
jgi:hypothetical protein